MIPPIADRFVAGETDRSVLAHARSLNDRGIGAICNRLGEHYEEPGDAEADAREYRRLLGAIDERGLRACVSVKPTQLGLLVDEGTYRRLLAEVVAAAETHDGFVWVDMEGPATTEATIAGLEAVATEHPGRTGICLQANLARTEADVDRLASVPARVRLVKGAYDPPAGEGVTDREAVDAAYEARLAHLVRTHTGAHQGLAVGTHDDAMIERARELAADAGVDLEVQLLMGVRESYQDELAGELDVWQYVPYGDRWVDYFTRRLTERTDNVLFALRALLGR